MNKNRIVLSVVGGVFGLALLVMLYMVWNSLSARTAATAGDVEEGVTGLEEVESKAQVLMRSKIFPCPASVKGIGENVARLEEWKKEARKLAARGDRVYAATTPAAFKTFIVADAKRLSALPGLVDGVLVKPGFAFGPFKDYISEGKMPAEAQLAELQRQWDDIATVTETLVAGGVAELLDVQLRKPSAEEAEEANRPMNRKKQKKPAKKAASDEPEPSASSYVFTFATRPGGFVKVVNALATCERFVVVDDFTFVHDHDVIVSALGGGEKKAEGGSAPRGRRGRRAVAKVEEPAEDAAGKLKNGIITDPVLDPPFKVTMTVTVYDFRTLEEPGKEEEEKK